MQPARHKAKALPTKEEFEAALPAAAKLIEKARAYIVLDHPFFATIMLKHPMTATNSIPTLAVSNRGDIYFNPVFIAQRTNDELEFALAHEIMHYASGHGLRRGHRDPKMWNYAGDMWINDTLKNSGFTLIPGVVDVPGSASRTVEDIYASFPQDDNGGGGDQGGQGGDQGQQGGQGGEDGSDDPIGDDIDNAPGESKTESADELDAQRKIEVSEAAQVAKMKGKLPGVLQDFAANTVETRTPWYDILERYMTERIANDTSWAKPNRRYIPGYYLPVTDGVGAMGEVVVQVDISGSVSRREIEHYNGHIKRIVEQCHPSKVHVIYTDTQVQRHDTFDKPEDVQINFYSGGGTDMRAGFEYIEEQDITPEVVVTLTDGYTPFPEDTDYPSVWCISTEHITSPTGVNVHFDVND